MRESEHTITPMLLGTNLIVKHTKWTKNYDSAGGFFVCKTCGGGGGGGFGGGGGD